MDDFIIIWLVGSIFIFLFWLFDDDKDLDWVFAVAFLWPVVLGMKLWSGLKKVWEDI